jgi:hypothetical protein
MTGLEQLKNHIDNTIGSLRTTLTQQQEEIKTLGQTRDETATAITELENQLETLGNELKEAVRKLGAPSGGDRGERKQTPGELFIASEQYAAMKASKSYSSSIVQVGTLLPPSRFALTTDVSDVGASVAVPPNRLPGFINPTLPALRMRDLIPVTGTTQGSLEYVRTTGFFPVVSKLTAAAADGATTLVVGSTAGFSPGQPILVGTQVRTVNAVTDDTHLTITQGVTGVQAVDTRVVSRVVAATPQTKLKPTGEFTDFSLETESIKTIATSIDVARQALDDVGQLRTFIDNQLTFEMGYTEEYNLLYGNGGSGQLHGLLTDPDRQVYNWSDGKVQVVGGANIADNKIDALRRALTLVQLARYPADGIVMHPYEWEDFELMKGSDGHYIWLSLPDGTGSTNFFRYPVVVTDAIQQGTALTGAFRLGTQLWDRETANVRASDQHDQNFKKNLVSLLAEERLAQTIYRPEAFVEVVFDAPPV